MSKGRERDIRNLVEGLGLRVLAVTTRGSGHYAAEVKAPTGATQKFFFSNTPSDHRGDLNKKAMIRRWVREQVEMST